MKIQKIVFALLFTVFSCHALSDHERAQGFVYLHEIDPTILVSLRYYTHENFVGKPVDGYEKAAVVITRAAAEKLKSVQAAVKKDGYCLLVYDAYRPQRAVDLFVRWAEDVQDQVKKELYYPRVDKRDVFDLGYVAKKSGHSRGSTVDLTLIKDGALIHDVVVTTRLLTDGFSVKFLDDGTVDMGSSFDLFDEASHTASTLVTPEYQKLRAYLKKVMEDHGFKNLSTEWWHYTLQNEPYAREFDSSYFDFTIA